jgi:hypothetical protein
MGYPIVAWLENW